MKIQLLEVKTEVELLDIQTGGCGGLIMELTEL